MACRHRRIVVIGATGSGKSTLAQRLARSLDVTFVELDALFWESEWTPAPPDVFRARADETTRGAEWVLAGNYPHVRDIVWPRAEAIVWLDYLLPLVFWRLTVRTVRRAVTREVLWSGNRENLREHLLLWSERSLFLLAVQDLLAVPARVPEPVRSTRARAPRDHSPPGTSRRTAMASIRSRLSDHRRFHDSRQARASARPRASRRAIASASKSSGRSRRGAEGVRSWTFTLG